MRKTKAEAEFTRQNLLEAAFQVFMETSYERTSLEQICKKAQVTRGAAYWHFKNKYELFEETVMETLNRIHAYAAENIVNNCDLSDEEILIELLCMPGSMPQDFLFVRKTVAYIQGHTELEELRQKMIEDKKKQYAYFFEPIKRIKAKNSKLDDISVNELTFLMFYSFDGIYIQDIPEELVIDVNRNLVEKYVYLLLRE